MRVGNKGTQDTPIRFYEVQYFWQQPLSWFVWVISGGTIWYLYAQGAIFSSVAYIAVGFTIVMVLVVSLTNLVTEISSEGISYRMWPFHRTPRLIKWDEVQDCEIRKYRPIREYGGWGVRIGAKGKAYNVKGNMGLQLILDNDKGILIGTQKPEELEEILGQLNLKS